MIHKSHAICQTELEIQKRFIHKVSAVILTTV